MTGRMRDCRPRCTGRFEDDTGNIPFRQPRVGEVQIIDRGNDDGGQRLAAKAQADATYDRTVADYRQTALTAFQEISRLSGW